MLVTVQFPLADLRPFVPGPTHRLLTPAWPTPRADIDFVRMLGTVRDRRSGGLTEWAGEHIFCDASRAIRFEAAFSVAGMLGVSRRRCAFRRFFSDGEGVSRVEVGIAYRDTLSTWKELLSVLHQTLALRTTIGRGSNAEKTELFKTDRALARLILRASTSATSAPDFTPASWWVTPCKPTLLVEYDAKRSAFQPPAAFRTISAEATRGIDLAYGRMNFFNRTVGVWLLGRKSSEDRDYERRFRIHILRLHAQREVVTEVLRAVETKRLDVQRTSPSDAHDHPSNRLQKFLRDTIERLERKQYGGVQQSELLQAAEEIQDSVTEGERTAILQRIQPLRRVVLSAVERFTEQKTPIAHTINVYEAGSYQTVKNEQHVTVSGEVGGDLKVDQTIAEKIDDR